MSEPQAIAAQQTTRRRGRPRNEETRAIKDAIEAAAKKNNQLTRFDIANKVGTSHQTVQRVLEKYAINQQDLEDFKVNRADIYAGVIGKIVASIDSTVIQNASLRDRATAAGILQDKERLERGQSTQNVASLHSIADRAIKAASNQETPSETVDR